MDRERKDPREVFKDMFICMIDFEPQRNPKLLKCGHSFCRDCLHGLMISIRRSSIDLVDVDDAGDRLKCPVCRDFTAVPEGGIDALPHNSLLEKLEDRVKELVDMGFSTTDHPQSQIPKSPSGVALCNMSVTCKQQRSPAKFYCHNCAKNCCQQCHSKHNKTFCHHKTVDLASDTACFIQCSEHEDEYISFFCLDCKYPMCTLCRIHNQKCISHTVVEIMEKDKVLEERGKIKEYMQDLKVNSDHVKTLSLQLQSIRKQIYDKYMQNEEEMQLVKQQLIERINFVWSEFENQRVTSREFALKLLNNAQEEINYQMTNYNSLIQFIDQLLQNKNTFQPLSLFDDLRCRVKAAKQDIPKLDALVPEVPVTRLVHPNPSVFNFGQVEEMLLKPFAQGDSLGFKNSGYSDKTMVSPRIVRDDEVDGGYFRPEIDAVSFNLGEGYSSDEGYFKPDGTLPIAIQSPRTCHPHGVVDGVFVEEPDHASAFTRETANRWSFSSYLKDSAIHSHGDLYGSSPHDEFGNIRRALSDMNLDDYPSLARVSIPVLKRNLNPRRLSFFKTFKKRLSSVTSTSNGKTNYDNVNIIWETSLKMSSTVSSSMLPTNIALSIEGQKVFILDPSLHCIVVFKNGKQETSLSLKYKPNMQPCSIAATYDGQVFCTDLANKSLEVFSHMLQSGHTWPCFPGDTPLGICVTPDASFVITVNMTKHSHVRICVYNHKGEVEENRSFPKNDESLLNPSVVVCDGFTIAVLDEQTNRLSTFDMQIHPLATFSNLDIKLEGLCLGLNREFYVTASNVPNTIMRYDEQLRLLGNMNLKLLEKIKKPHRLTSCLNDDGEILLAISTPIRPQEIGILVTDLNVKKN